MKLIFTLVVTLLFLVMSCNKDKVQTSEFTSECEDEISFNSDIKTIISTSCATSGCHNAAAASSGYILESHEQISSNAEILMSVIRHEEGVVAMPIGAPKLTDEFVEKFFCWMEQGKQNN